ncbi:meiotic recombination protein SPO11 isoform X3 [Pelodiscus sinensis]|uniref:meiotic recombination protein SPO11 isoform X3 n=1 Tax=Pelodiscus sinensis TaxID=13735 RepID=UPI000D72196E|nr:meiotic recombination protein SPO11 isoform X1 [Pelodiscus sinensis]|eukprot:XP_025041558.1 meiotic recombination protein SPO11 isoform X1 [Pelodiscus sinensis]
MSLSLPGVTDWSAFTFLDHHRTALLQSIKEESREETRIEETGPSNNIREITCSEILGAIENVIQDIVTSLARNKAPVLTLVNRSDWRNIQFKDSVGLQMISHHTTRKIKSDCPKSATKFALILKMLSVIYKMVQDNTYATKRDIYYSDTLLFGSQSVVDNIVNDISCMLKIPRRSLHILSTTKGCISGNLSYTEEDGTKVNCTCNATAVIVPSNVQGIRNVITDAKFILIVEKDATFQRLLDDDFCNKLSPCIMITGKGVPDLNTRLLVRKLWDTCHIPIFTLMDADPHGIEIMCIYKYGSVSMSFEAHHLTVPAIRWLGLLPSDIERLNIPKDALIPLTKRDQNKLASMQKRPYMACQPMWKKEMEIMAASKMKAEIQALMSLSSDYLSRVYLPNKLQFGGWI